MEFKIEQTQHNIKITLEGLDITNAVRGFEVSRDAWGKMTNIRLDLCVDQIEVSCLGERDVTVQVNVTPEATEALQALGWVKTDNRYYTIPREDLSA